MLLATLFAQNKMAPEDFLKEMSGNFANRDSGSDQAKFILFGVLGFLLLIVLLHLLIKNRKRIRGFGLRMLRRMSGGGLGDPRYKAFIDVTLDVPYAGEKVCRTKTSNLSPGGMFVKMNPPLALHEKFRFRLALAADLVISGIAEVVWVQDGWSEHHPSGCGCKFTGLLADDKNRIRAWIQKNKPSRAQ